MIGQLQIALEGRFGLGARVLQKPRDFEFILIGKKLVITLRDGFFQSRMRHPVDQFTIAPRQPSD